MKRILFTFLILTFAGGGLFAQSNKVKRAKTLMDKLDYISAIEELNQILEKNDDTEAKILIAEAYRKISDSENSEFWYGQVVRLPEAEPIHKLFYGQALQRNGKCELARDWYMQYVEDVPDDLRGQYLVKACDYETELRTKNAGIYEISHLEFNSNLDDFSPSFYKDGLVFASERDQGAAIRRTHSWTGHPFLELFKIKVEEEKGEECGNYTFGNPEKLSKDVNSKFHDAVVSFNDNQSKVFFTRNNFIDGKTGKSDDGVVKLKVYTADVNGDKWDNMEGLPFNSDEYSVAHPTLTPEGDRLFFTSDMPGGFGGMDMYVSEQENGSWGPPINLGPQVNTEGNELFPYYHKDGKLYFSSDGHIGLGGLDIYFMEDKGNEEWGAIENVGFPINTISDDFGIVFNEEGTCGFLSSDRTGGAGRDDIYSFKKIASPIEIFVYDEATGEPIAEAVIENSCGGTLTTNDKGKAMVDMKMGLCCTFAASKELYEDNTVEGCTKDIKLGERVLVEIPLSKQLEFDIEGIVFDQRTGLPLEGAIVTLTNDCEDELQELVTDATGRYYFKLKKDCCYKVKGAKETYLAATVDNQCTRDLSESTTLQANLNLQPTIAGDDILDPNNPNTEITDANDPCDVYKDLDTGLYIDRNTGLPADGPCGGKTYKGGVITDEGGFDPGISPVKPGEALTFLLHVYYDFNQSYIRDEAESELGKLLTTLEENPQYIVEIGSHTDSRGSNRYNNRLSQRRAEAVVRWLVERGVDRSRLVARGYGETVNVNNCSNNIPCSEQQHQMNRRTEFKIVGCSDCTDSRVISAPNENARVDECQGCPF